MDESKTNALVIVGSAVAGGAFGAWAGANIGAAYGLRAGPWGVVAATIIGQQYRVLRELLSGLTVLGGCCGTINPAIK